MSAPTTNNVHNPARLDLDLIAGLIPAKARVLDIGCGEGELLLRLTQQNQVEGRGIELSQQGVNACVAKGLAVVQGDAETDLANYPANGFDYAILSQTIQQVHRPDLVLDDLLRIARRAIISFPNFGHWRVRLNLLWRGRMPQTGILPHQWYETQNLHLCTIRDFAELAAAKNFLIERFLPLNGEGRPRAGMLANFFAEQAVFVLARRP